MTTPSNNKQPEVPEETSSSADPDESQPLKEPTWVEAMARKSLNIRIQAAASRKKTAAKQTSGKRTAVPTREGEDETAQEAAELKEELATIERRVNQMDRATLEAKQAELTAEKDEAQAEYNAVWADDPDHKKQAQIEANHRLHLLNYEYYAVEQRLKQAPRDEELLP